MLLAGAAQYEGEQKLTPGERRRTVRRCFSLSEKSPQLENMRLLQAGCSSCLWQACRDGTSRDAAMDAAERSLQEQWPELSAKEASAEVVAAIAYASSHHPTCLWDGVVP